MRCLLRIVKSGDLRAMVMGKHPVHNNIRLLRLNVCVGLQRGKPSLLTRTNSVRKYRKSQIWPSVSFTPHWPSVGIPVTHKHHDPSLPNSSLASCSHSGTASVASKGTKAAALQPDDD